MRIGLQTWGTEGDVRPFFALAQGLMARGHEVKLLYSNIDGRSFDALAAGCGIDARCVGRDYFLANHDAVTARLAKIFSLGNPLRQVHGTLEVAMDPIVDEMLDSAMELARQSDVVVGHFMTHTAGSAAAAHGKPYVLLALAPLLPSASYPPVGMPDLGSVLNPLLWKVLGRVLESVLKDRINRTRGRAGLSPIKNLMASMLDHAALGLTAVSPSLFPRPRDWDPRLSVTGFLRIVEASEPWEPEPHLRAFLDAGPPPAFLSFGSLVTLMGDTSVQAVRALASAVLLAGVRGVIQAPAAMTAGFANDPRLCFITRASHARLFPLCSAIVHHGGAGTTQSATLAGRPSVVVPHGADQFFWGDRLHALGIGAKPLARGKLSAERLAPLLRRAMDDRGMRAKAEEAAVLLGAEDGATMAAERIESAVLASLPRPEAYRSAR